MFSIPETLLGDRIALEGHIADDVVLTKNGDVLAMFLVAGVFPGTADEGDVANWFDQIHNTLKNIAADDIELIVYQCRGELDPSVYGNGVHRSVFAQDLGDAYKNNMFRHTLYLNKLYLSVQVYAPSAASQTASKFVAEAGSDPMAGVNERKDRLNEICALLTAQLKAFNPHRLGYVPRGNGLFDEIAEAIVFAMTGVYRQIGATTGRMRNAMFSETIRFRRKRVEFHGPGETTYAQMYGFKEYPSQTFPGMFSNLGNAPYRNTLVQSYRFLSNADGESVISRKQGKMMMANDKAKSQIAELMMASDKLLRREFVMGDHSLVLIAFADNAKAMSEVGNASWRDLAACGLVATRMTRALQAAYLSMLPGAASWRPRPGYVKSSNFVAFSPFYNWPAGQSLGQWPGPPIATFRTVAGTPYKFHWHVGDVGSTLITGTTGAGKTLGTSFLIAMTTGRARVVALDYKRGWDFMIREMGGDYAILGAGEPHLSPLKALDGSLQNIEFLTTLFRGCIGGEMTEEEGRRLSIGLNTIMTCLPPAMRSVGELRAFFDSEPEGAGARLEKWIFGNELGWVLDAPVDNIRFFDLSGLDVTALMENSRARGPALLYLYHRIFLMLDGTPLLLPVDEGWRALMDPIFSAAIERAIRTIRSKGGVLVFITQEPEDIVKSGIGHVLASMCPTQFHYANPKGSREDYVVGLKLTEGQWLALKPLKKEDHMFLLIQGDQSVVAQMPMQGMDHYIRILSAREVDLKQADRERASLVVPRAEYQELEAAE